MKATVIKIGGHDIAAPDFLNELAVTIRDFGSPVIIVHGGGIEISEMQKVMGIEPFYLDGVRVTDGESLKVVEMVLGGLVNRRLVRYLVTGGVEAMGMTGVDRGMIRAVQMQHPTQDMGMTGEVSSVRREVLLDMLEGGITPVIAPLCLGEDQPITYNVNADHVAGAVAQAVQADRIIFITNVEGVLIDEKPVGVLSTQQAHALIADGTIFGGMIPKVRTAISILDMGVPQSVITNLTGLKSHGGTVFSIDRS